MSEQLLLFADDKIDRLERKQIKTDIKLETMRRSLYARNGALEKKIEELQDKVDIMIRNTCRNDALAAGLLKKDDE